MSLQELEDAVSALPKTDLDTFAQWFEEFLADQWDRQIEADARAGRRDAAAEKAEKDFDNGRCTPL